jgi:hypothetical protein
VFYLAFHANRGADIVPVGKLSYRQYIAIAKRRVCGWVPR